MMRVSRYVCRDGFMTLKTGRRALHLWLELIISPGLHGFGTRLGMVHLMTGQAGEGSFLIAGRFDHTRKLPSTHSHHAIRPKAVCKKSRLLLDGLKHLRQLLESGCSNGFFVPIQATSGPVTKAIEIIVPRVRDPMDPMALTAHHGGSFMIKLGRVDDCWIRFFQAMLFIAPHGAVID